MVSNGIDSFVAEVRAYCEFVDRAAAMPLADRLTSARERLLKLYITALLLPSQTEPGDVHAGPSPERPVGWQGFESKELYADVRRGLDLWDRSHQDAAIWEWRFHFDIHWGDHAIDALRALHRACKEPSRTEDHA